VINIEKIKQKLLLLVNIVNLRTWDRLSSSASASASVSASSSLRLYLQFNFQSFIFHPFPIAFIDNQNYFHLLFKGNKCRR
jgi:hypothetical protein